MHIDKPFKMSGQPWSLDKIENTLDDAISLPNYLLSTKWWSALSQLTVKIEHSLSSLWMRIDKAYMYIAETWRSDKDCDQ